jgi:NADH-quinone oxidoreductase subunit A
MYQYEYFIVLIFIIFSFFLSSLLIFLSYMFSQQNPDFEKLTSYECGFNPFEDSRIRFDIRYYLVAILFIIFDLEVMFLFPWAMELNNLFITSNLLGFFSMMFFLFILTIGFVYEWKKGALEW